MVRSKNALKDLSSIFGELSSKLRIGCTDIFFAIKVAYKCMIVIYCSQIQISFGLGRIV